MKIISGKLKGSSLYITKDKTTRPLKNIARESIFNLLEHSKKVSFKFEQAVILDLYSGTGSFGLECLSRQAKKVFFIEKDNHAIETLKKNIDKLKLNNKSEIYFNDVFKVIEKKNVFNFKFNLIFCDPPFKDLDLQKLILLISEKNLLQKDGIIILHRNKNTIDKLPNCFNTIEVRNYGISKIIFGNLLS